MIERSRVRIPAGAAGEFSSPESTFCADSYFGIRSVSHVTALARKRPRSFCRQKRRWQVTAKYAYSLRIHLALHEVTWFMVVHRTRRDGSSHASAVITPLRWIFKKRAIKKKKLFTHVESHASAVSLLESREWRYIKAINNNKNNNNNNVGCMSHEIVGLQTLII